MKKLLSKIGKPFWRGTPKDSTAMTDFFGGWSLSGKPIEQLLSREERASMLSVLSAPERDFSETLEGPLWMVAEARCTRRQGDRFLAYTGYVAASSRASSPMPSFFDEPWTKLSQDWQGHFVLAQAQLRTPCLWLFRDPLGGECLYYVCLGDLVLFANSIRALLAHPRVLRELDEETAAEFILSEDASIVFGNRTLWRGILEVLPGQWLLLSKEGLSIRGCVNPLLFDLQESAEYTPQRLRKCLSEAMTDSIGSDKQVAILLSGGIDSSAVAAVAAELLGPKNVHAFTYEFDEPAHVSEAPYAEATARELGIDHHVIKISYEAYFDSIPELIWRTESPRVRAGTWLLAFNEIARRGFRKVITGMGMEHLLGLHQHDAFINGRLIRWNEVSNVDSILKPFADRFLSTTASPTGATLAMPSELHYLLLCLWQRAGKVQDAAYYYPEDLKALVRSLSRSERVREAIEPLRSLPFMNQVRQSIFDFYTGFRSGRGRFKTWNELGVQVLSPALFTRCISETPYLAWQSFHSAGTYRRSMLLDFRWLLIEAMRGRLSDSILFREKMPEQSPVPKEWPSRILDSLKTELAEEALQLSPAFVEARSSLQAHYSSSLVQLSLLRRVFFAQERRVTPPNWKDLGFSV